MGGQPPTKGPRVATPPLVRIGVGEKKNQMGGIACTRGGRTTPENLVVALYHSQ